ncbi:MAG: hypothetical protein R3B96_19150 [Pirellulaceae bacterium]
MKHIVIVPYFSEPEIDRYLRIADRLRQFGSQGVDYQFLLAASPKIEPNDRLYQGFSDIAPCQHFQCPTRIFGYPQGPTAMFWDCMDHVANEHDLQGGFSLWLESDMVPVKRDWLARLASEWSEANSPLIMGCYVPDVQKKRFFRRARLWISEHINGGACYSNDFAHAMPLDAREGVFDTQVYQFLKETGRVVNTRQIAFSTTQRLQRDAARADRVLLHGFLQDKEAFVTACLATDPDAAVPEEQPAWKTSLSEAGQKALIRFVIRGRRAMLGALLIEQDRLERQTPWRAPRPLTPRTAPARKAA